MADKGTAPVLGRPIRGYEFNEFVIGLATRLRASLKACGARSIQIILGIINECFGNKLFDKIPSHTTIDDWCEKAGLDMYMGVKDNYAERDYVTIVDESLSVGKQKLLAQVAVPADCVGKPLSLSDVDILGLAVQPSWKSDEVKEAIQKTSKEVGRKPLYVVSDCGGNLCRACTDAALPHHCDISHSFGNILKKYVAESSDFKEFTELMDKKRLSYHLTGKVIVLPPKQRAIARFMNVSNWVFWAMNILDVYDKLPEVLQEACSYVLEYRALIEELNAIIKCMNYVEKRCKNDGLSLSLSDYLIQVITRDLITSKEHTKRMQKVGIDMWVYLKKECELLESPKDKHIISSDVIESSFGVFKSVKSPDKLCGVTRHVLALPLSLKFTSSEERRKFDFKKAMENVHYRDLQEWSDLNLYGNPAQDRKNLTRKVG